MLLHRTRPARWSAIAGSYSTNAFSIRLPHDTPVIDPVSLRLAGDDPENLSVLVHEYWHYLQNLTTVAGFVSFVLQQDFVAVFSETLMLNADGTSVGSDAIGGDVADRIEELTAMLDAREGQLEVDTINEDEVIAFRITGVDEDDHTLTRRGGPVPLRKVTLNIEAEMTDGSIETGTLIFGQACVEEGVAYLIDRVVAAGGVGAAGADDAPPFPYWVLRELALTGTPVDLSAIEIASLGTLALLTTDPAGNFLQIRDDYAIRRAAGRTMADALDEVWQALRPYVQAAVETIVRNELPSLVAMHSGRGLMQIAAQWLANQYTALLEWRLSDPLFDLRPFSHNRTDLPRLNHLLRTVLPCNLTVERVGDTHAVERDVMVAFGMPGYTSNGYHLTDILRVLEAQVHFVMSHLGADQFGSTADVEHHQAYALDEDVSPCPFYTTCGLQLRSDKNDICFRRPWRIFDASRPNCWYGTAVASTLGVIHIGNIIRDPREEVAEHQRIIEAVRRRAYEIWEERGRETGNDWHHWFEARQELGIAEDYIV